MKGGFIVIDGIDGSGKSTQVALLKKALGKTAVFTHDPGGTPMGEAVRALLLGTEKLSPLTTFLLFLTARAALVEDVIAPALKKGKLVVSDRFDSSTYAYQIYGGKQSDMLPLMRSFSRYVLKDARPDMYIILDSKPEMARKRLFSAGKELNAYDKKPLSYHRRIRAGFKAFKSKGSRVYFVDADRDPEIVHHDVLQLVRRYTA